MLVWKNMASVKHGVYMMFDNERGNLALAIVGRPYINVGCNRSDVYRLDKVTMYPENASAQWVKVVRASFTNIDTDFSMLNPGIVLRDDVRDHFLVSTVTGRLVSYVHGSALGIVFLGGPSVMEFNIDTFYAFNRLVGIKRAITLAIMNGVPANDRIEELKGEW